MYKKYKNKIIGTLLALIIPVSAWAFNEWHSFSIFKEVATLNIFELKNSSEKVNDSLLRIEKTLSRLEQEVKDIPKK
jgi:hypothetical protein